MISKPKNIASVLFHLLQLILYGAAHVTWQIKDVTNFFCYCLQQTAAMCSLTQTDLSLGIWIKHFKLKVQDLTLQAHL